ncbi:hypothetical protein BB558_003290 [Smittium angustum]|uniref:VLRF1 domain-containing protein n=1 Tax=Smittium angustum TaxID=133377 RepID=A0A2U1J6H2_SMIAN|nr:hypothetical protein BB558_003290 [Smittium angustum]
MQRKNTATWKVFNFPTQIVENLSYKNTFKFQIQNHDSSESLIEENPKIQAADLSLELPSDKKSCILCGEYGFQTTAEQRAHYKTEKHRENLINKINGIYPKLPESSENSLQKNFVTMELFDDSFNPEIDSNNGEIGDKNGNLPKHSAKTWFSLVPNVKFSETDKINIKDQKEGMKMIQYGIFKGVIQTKKDGKKTEPSTMLQELKNIQLGKNKIPNNQKQADSASGKKNTDAKNKVYWVILQLSGGHFAGGVFDIGADKIVAHKTIHRYTTRRKQGTSQSSHDKAKGQPAKSAGAQIRRYNEIKLMDDISSILLEWKNYLTSSSRIFQSTSKATRRVFFGNENSVIPYDSEKIRICPIQIGRPSLLEIERVYKVLSSVYIREIDFKQQSSPKNALGGSQDIPNLSEQETKSDEYPSDSDSEGTLEPEPRPELVAFLYNAAKVIPDQSKSDEQVLEFLESNEELLLDAFLDPATELRYLEKCPDVRSNKTPTLLHLASMYGRNKSIVFLLDHGDDPTITNGFPPMYSGGRTAYELSPNRETRDVFRKYRFENEKVLSGNSTNEMDADAIYEHDEYSEWNETRIPKGWKEPVPKPQKVLAESNKKPKQPKANKNKNPAPPQTKTETRKPTSSKQPNNKEPSEKQGSGILELLKNKPQAWNDQHRFDSNNSMMLSQASNKLGKTLSGVHPNRIALSRSRNNPGPSNNPQSSQNEEARQRELRAKAAEARLAHFSKKS